MIIVAERSSVMRTISCRRRYASKVLVNPGTWYAVSSQHQSQMMNPARMAVNAMVSSRRTR
jgi:hypothetical protein